MRIIKLIASLLLSFSAAAIGTIATIPNIPTWYATLDKPFFSPPNWLFGPVWTFLYVLIGISFYLVWIFKTKRSKRIAYSIFFAQLLLNALWSVVFFGLHSLQGGLVIITALLVSIVILMVSFWRIQPIASSLLAPYLLWVSFATCLTIALVLIN